MALPRLWAPVSHTHGRGRQAPPPADRGQHGRFLLWFPRPLPFAGRCLPPSTGLRRTPAGTRRCWGVTGTPPESLSQEAGLLLEAAGGARDGVRATCVGCPGAAWPPRGQLTRDLKGVGPVWAAGDALQTRELGRRGGGGEERGRGAGSPRVPPGAEGRPGFLPRLLHDLLCKHRLRFPLEPSANDVDQRRRPVTLRLPLVKARTVTCRDTACGWVHV